MYIPVHYQKLIKLINKLLVLFKFYNKYLYILPLISILSSILGKISNNKIFKLITWLIKIIVIINIIVSVGYILYFTGFENPFDKLFSFYSDLLEPYIHLLKSLWNDLKNINIEDSFSVKDSNVNIKNEIKEAIKEGIKESFEDILDELKTQADIESQGYSNLLKQLALFSSVALFSYFFFVLPGSNIEPEVFSQYNWFNQSLIEFKITVNDLIINLISNPKGPSNPGSPSIPNALIDSPVVPIITNLDNYLPVSPTVSSDGMSTVTPNTPRVSNLSTYIETSTQTYLDGTSVSKFQETVNILSDALNKEESIKITDAVNKVIKNITD
jgi:hypothetical protein